LAARRIDGAEQFFSRAYDFGFCKTSEEALQTWGHDKILSDVVWVIRKFKPDVIIARFPEDSRQGMAIMQLRAFLPGRLLMRLPIPLNSPNNCHKELQYGNPNVCYGIHLISVVTIHKARTSLSWM
jgi:hypothetical protein